MTEPNERKLIAEHCTWLIAKLEEERLRQMALKARADEQERERRERIERIVTGQDEY